MKQIITLIAILIMPILTFGQDKNFYIYLCLGQSNMYGQAPYTSEDSIVSNRFFNFSTCNDDDRKIGDLRPGVPPLCRRWSKLGPSDFFARYMVDHLPENIKVGTILVCVNGCAVDLFDKVLYKNYVDSIKPDWQRREVAKYDGNPYKRLIEVAKLAQKKGVIKGIIYHQGETDAYSDVWLNKMKKIYNDILTDLDLKAEEVPLLAGETVGADQNGVCQHANPTIDRIHDFIPTAWPISSYACKVSEDNVHFAREGYQRIGMRYAIKMLQLMGYDIPDDKDSQLQSGTVVKIPTINTELNTKKVVTFNSELPINKIDLVSYSGETLKSLDNKGKKTGTIKLAKYKEDRIIIIFHSTDGQRIPRQINL